MDCSKTNFYKDRSMKVPANLVLININIKIEKKEIFVPEKN